MQTLSENKCSSAVAIRGILLADVWETVKGIIVKQSLDAQLDGVREQYGRDGYVVVRGAIDEELARETRNHVEWLIEQNPGKRPEQLDHSLIKDDPFWLRLVGDDRLLDIAGQFIGPDIALFASHYIAKPPSDGQPVLWHQDGSFWPLEPMEVVTLWLAADESTPENGCMRVIPGTHKMDLTEMKQNTSEENVLEAEIDSLNWSTSRGLWTSSSSLATYPSTIPTSSTAPTPTPPPNGGAA